MNSTILSNIKNFADSKHSKKSYVNNNQVGGSYLDMVPSYPSEGKKFISNNYVATSNIPNSGLGVFANQDYKEGDVVEINKFLEIDNAKIGLQDIVFGSHLNANKSLVILGNGSIFNHHDNNNLTYHYMNGKDFYFYRANKYIKKDDELFIYYGDNWFSKHNIQKNDQ